MTSGPQAGPWYYGQVGQLTELVRMTRGTLALIAHDGKKSEMADFAQQHASVLQQWNLVGTAATASLVADRAGLNVERVLSGPMGGDVQIAARIADEKIRAVLFFVDPLNAHPHDPDIQAIQRVCNVHSVALATNAATAEMIIEVLKREK